MLGLFKRNPTSSDDHAGPWRSFVPEGIAIGRGESDLPDCGLDARTLDNPAVDGLLAQMDDDGRLTTLAGTKLLPWADLFDLLEGPEQISCRDLLCLPQVVSHVPSLLSIDSLRDPTFRIVVEDWRGANLGRPSRAETCGAIIIDDGEIGLLPRKTAISGLLLHSIRSIRFCSNVHKFPLVSFGGRKHSTHRTGNQTGGVTIWLRTGTSTRLLFCNNEVAAANQGRLRSSGRRCPAFGERPAGESTHSSPVRRGRTRYRANS